MTTLPEQLRRSLTWDRGKEMSAARPVHDRDRHPGLLRRPAQPWQRGTNENTNGLLRQYFPKGTDLSRWTADDIEAVAPALNTRPRKTLGWKTPAEALDEHLRSIHKPVLRPPVEPSNTRPGPSPAARRVRPGAIDGIHRRLLRQRPSSSRSGDACRPNFSTANAGTPASSSRTRSSTTSRSSTTGNDATHRSECSPRSNTSCRYADNTARDQAS